MATNSSQSSRAAKISAAIILTLALCGGAGYLGYRAGEGNLMYRFFAEMVETQDRMPVVIEYMIGRTTSYALYGQDLWLLNHVYPGVHNGFFVDLGSAGEADSNSKLLEIHGWSGICIDPFPSNMDNRVAGCSRRWSTAKPAAW